MWRKQLSAIIVYEQNLYLMELLHSDLDLEQLQIL